MKQGAAQSAERAEAECIHLLMPSDPPHEAAQLKSDTVTSFVVSPGTQQEFNKQFIEFPTNLKSHIMLERPVCTAICGLGLVTLFIFPLKKLYL